jgi:hypothetical protein
MRISSKQKYPLFIYRPYKPKRLKGKRSAKLTSKSSSSSTSDDDSPDSVSPIPRVRSIEALEFLTHAKQQRMAAMMMMHQQQQQQINSNSKTGSQNFQKPQHQTTNHFTPNNLQLQNNAKSQHRQVNRLLYTKFVTKFSKNHL